MKRETAKRRSGAPLAAGLFLLGAAVPRPCPVSAQTVPQVPVESPLGIPAGAGAAAASVTAPEFGSSALDLARLGEGTRGLAAIQSFAPRVQARPGFAGAPRAPVLAGAAAAADSSVASGGILHPPVSPASKGAGRLRPGVRGAPSSGGDAAPMTGGSSADREVRALAGDPELGMIRAQSPGFEYALDSLYDRRGESAAAGLAVSGRDSAAPRVSGLAPSGVGVRTGGAISGLPVASPEGAKAEPVPLPSKPDRRWIGRVVLMSAAFLAFDWGTKFLFAATGLPFVYHVLGPVRLLIMKFMVPMNLLVAGYYVGLAHSKEAPLRELRRFRERHPVLGGALYALLSVLTFPVGLGERRYAGDLAEKYPIVRKIVRLVDWTAAGLVAAGLGNGLEAIVRGKVVDFIPFGHGRMNFSDSFIFLGMPLLWMALDFFKEARKADAAGTPITFKSWRYWLLPLLGFVGFVYSTSWGYAAIPIAGWYVLLFSTLFSIGIFLGDIVIQRFVEAFNRSVPAGRRSPPAH